MTRLPNPAALPGAATLLSLALSAGLVPSQTRGPTCPDNIVQNADFAAGLVPGSMPGASVANWTLLTNTPQVVTDTCSGPPGAIQMWGNKVVGESVQQTLATTIVAGRKYRVSVCYRWLDNGNPVLPKYVRFRLCASGTAPAAYPPASTYSVIGTTPNTSSTSWISYTLPDWTAPSNASFLTLNPENDSSVNHGDFVSWGQIDDICIREVDTCPGNVVRNSDFSSGLVPGSMPAGSVASWSVLTNTPQVVTDTCTGAPGAIQMWGNLVVGESIKQTLSTPIVAGRTYQISICYRWLDAGNPVLPKYVRFRLCASGAAPTVYPATSSYDVIGTAPNTSSTTWVKYTFPKWRAPNNASYLTINPENDSTVNHGDFVSWGQIDDICIVDCCPANIVKNADFASGLVFGSMPSASVANWSLLTNTPQVVADTCSGPQGAVQMWGNLVVGESIQQTLSTPIVAGRKYRVTVCYRWLDNGNPVLPKYVRFRLCATGAAPAAYPPVSTYSVIGSTPNTSSTAWISHTFPTWTAPANATFLTINPENDSTTNHGDFVSWGQIDDICIQDVTKLAAVSVYGAGCLLSQGGTTPTLGSLATLSVYNIPAGSLAGVQLLGGVQNPGFPLDPIGMRGCQLLINPEFASLPFAIPGSSTTMSLDIPNDPNLIGAVLGAQAVTVSPGANTLGVLSSNGVELTLGL
jgi:hypothetical protein